MVRSGGNSFNTAQEALFCVAASSWNTNHIHYSIVQTYSDVQYVFQDDVNTTMMDSIYFNLWLVTSHYSDDSVFKQNL